MMLQLTGTTFFILIANANKYNRIYYSGVLILSLSLSHDCLVKSTGIFHI